MQTNKLDAGIRVAGLALLGLMLTGCKKPGPENTPVPPSDPPVNVAPAVPETPPAETPTPPAPEAPPPAEPSPVPKPAASQEPPVESMLAAVPSTKMSIAADLRYSFDGPVLPNQPVNVHIAAVPRAGGASMTVSVQEDPGLQIAATPLNVQKTSALGVYRQQFSLTKLAAGTRQVRVLVIMESEAGSAFGYFTIPLDGGTNPQKQESLKQH